MAAFRIASVRAASASIDDLIRNVASACVFQSRTTWPLGTANAGASRSNDSPMNDDPTPTQKRQIFPVRITTPPPLTSHALASHARTSLSRRAASPCAFPSEAVHEKTTDARVRSLFAGERVDGVAERTHAVTRA